MTTTPTHHPPTNYVGTTTFLSSGDSDVPRSLMFGVLVTLATPHVTHYLSDLYHDATMVREHKMTGDTWTFHYVVREYGTHLYDPSDPRWTFATADYWSRNSDVRGVYRVHVYRDDRSRWFVDVSSLLSWEGAE